MSRWSEAHPKFAWFRECGVLIGKRTNEDDSTMDRLNADILPENRQMQRMCEREGFTLFYNMGDFATLNLRQAGAVTAPGDGSSSSN